MPHSFQESIAIDAPAAVVWESLTDPAHMRAWMGEPAMKLEVLTDWIVGSPFIVRGFHYGRFENRGTVLAFEPSRRLSYTHLSSLSKLPDESQNYTIFDFRLAQEEERTLLQLELSQFPTETIFKHLAFYWPATLDVLKRYVEHRTSSLSSGS